MEDKINDESKKTSTHTYIPGTLRCAVRLLMSRSDLQCVCNLREGGNMGTERGQSTEES